MPCQNSVSVGCGTLLVDDIPKYGMALMPVSKVTFRRIVALGKVHRAYSRVLFAHGNLMLELLTVRSHWRAATRSGSKCQVTAIRAW